MPPGYEGSSGSSRSSTRSSAPVAQPSSPGYVSPRTGVVKRDMFPGSSIDNTYVPSPNSNIANERRNAPPPRADFSSRPAPEFRQRTSVQPSRQSSPGVGVARSLDNRPLQPLANPPAQAQALSPTGGLGTMEKGFLDLINGQVGPQGCSMVSSYVLLKETEGFRIACGEGVRYEIHRTGGRALIKPCSPSLSLDASC